MLPPRRADVIGEADVLVVGGGPAGLGAAVGAADAGAQVILVERYGFLGGCATAALVTTMMSFHTQQHAIPLAGTPALFPSDHGYGNPVISGVLGKLVRRLVKSGGAIPPSLGTGYVVPFDPEIFKQVAFELLDEAGVKFLLHAFASDVTVSGNINGVVFETKSGPVVIKAKAIVDCTGDGDIAAMAGAAYDCGRESDGLTQPMSLMFRIMDFNRSGFDKYVEENPGQWYGVRGLRSLINKAVEEGMLDMQREDILFFGTTRERELSINSTRVIKVLGTDVWDLTYAEWKGREQIRRIADFLRRFVPGFENSYVIQSGVNVGVRETRRIRGEYRLSADDVLGARKFDDVIARGSYPIDIHNPAGKRTFIRRLPPGEAYDIPMRCLLPRGVENLTVAGRCISGTHEAQSSYRTMPICIATGQAAGVCAALAAARGITPSVLPADVVQSELLRQGADLGERL